MSVTIKDVAKAAGVSYSTVSKALRDSPLVKHPTKEHIKEIAKQLGYQPNVVARSLVSKRSQTIGIVWPTIERIAHSALVTSLNKKLEEMSYTSLISINEAKNAFNIFNQYHVDAILAFNESEKPQKENSTVPVVIYGVACNESPYPVLDVNRQKAIYLAYQHLYQLGHRKISYIGYLESDYLQMKKVEGFNQAVADFKAPPFPNQVIEVQGLEQLDGYEAAKHLFEAKTKVTAIISGSHDLTRGIFKAVEEKRLSVPDDLSIISYDNIPETQNFDHAVTTVGVPNEKITDALTEILINIIEETEIEPVIFLEPELHLLNSCASLKLK